MAFSDDSGLTWTKAAGRPSTAGPFYGGDLATDPANEDQMESAVICGPKGANISLDGGKSWKNVTRENIWVAKFENRRRAWLAGTDGRVLRLDLLT